MYHIRSTYDEWAPEFDDYPEGRQWRFAQQTYALAWGEVRHYLLTKHRWRNIPPHGLQTEQAERWPLAPHGHTEPTARYGDTTILNDAETIEIIEHDA